MRDLWLYLQILHRLGRVKSVLDVGCGDGDLVTFLAGSTGKKVVGLDISDVGFNKASKNADKAGIPNLVECVKCDAHKIKECLRDRRFKAVILTYTLHHIQQPTVALRQIQEVLNEDGKVILADFVVGKRRGKCHRFTANEFVEIVQRAGFRDLEFEQAKPDVVVITAKK